MKFQIPVFMSMSKFIRTTASISKEFFAEIAKAVETGCVSAGRVNQATLPRMRLAERNFSFLGAKGPVRIVKARDQQVKSG